MSDDAIVFAAVAESVCQPHSLDLVKTSPNFSSPRRVANHSVVTTNESLGEISTVSTSTCALNKFSVERYRDFRLVFKTEMVQNENSLL